MTSNFQFLAEEWTSLYKKMQKAESRIRTEPISAATYCRLSLEECLHHLYKEHHITLPYNKTLRSLMEEQEIRSIIPARLDSSANIVRKIGNNAAHHGRSMGKEEALRCVRHLYDFLKWFAQDYSDAEPDLPQLFDETLIPKAGAAQRKLHELKKEHKSAQAALLAQIERLEAEKAEALERAKGSEAAKTQYEQEIATAKATIAAQKEARTTKLSSEYNEAETRQHLIDATLREAGWHELRKGRELEYPVQGMPVTRDNPRGNGFVDYVLWDDNGKPLAVIEAKRTNKSVEVGRQQAKLYADCLEKMHGQRPFIFYTNGYETMLWDDQFYSAPRRVYGFYTKDELQWKMQQRKTRKDIRTASVNEEIAGRDYQMQAIQRVAENFVVDSSSKTWRGDKQRALLVMATGSGKTRTSAALVEILMKHNWAKRVLFLADRNALVSQAKRSFGEYLPEISAIDLTREKENTSTRLVFSTYPSMLHQIDSARTDAGRMYGVGHFDLIIVDEAHRSVYNRYRAIFEYFDAMVVGLTATPKDSIDHNTFELFGCADEDPTFSYELEEAVDAGYLTPYQNINVATKFVREGIKYNELSEEEKAKYEETFRDAVTGLFPEEIGAGAMNKWLFNTDTVNKVLDALMENGLRIEGGDKLGRSIIFAANQKHAQFIVECFQKRYPEQPADFIATVHNKVSHAQSLIDAFCDKDKELNPQIAVSVDMMDTGIDAPRVLNLVFFKVVRSYAKFWQMIGRGTRLCPDVFGPKQPKKHFLIFDVCENFEFFAVNQKGKQSSGSKPLSAQIFEARLQLSQLLLKTGDAENATLATALLDKLHKAIQSLDKERFQVQMQLKYVDKFSEREAWNTLSNDDCFDVESHLSSLPKAESVHQNTRRFDLMMLKLQIANLLELDSEKRYQNNLMGIATKLSEKYTIPQVLRAKATLESLKNPDFYDQLKQRRLEEIRAEVRELMQYLEAENTAPIYTNIEDSEVTLTAGEPIVPYSSEIYKKRVERFIRENKQHLTISKLSSNQAITAQELQVLEDILFDGEERGTREDFVATYGEQPLGTFVRSILGLDVTAAHEAFAEFLQAGKLSADQMTFIQNIITYLTKNGTIDKGLLAESPFNDMHDQGIFGLFDAAEIGKIVRILDRVNGNAEVA